MKPNIGDIYCVYVDKLQQYAACQVTGLQESSSSRSHGLISIVELDWTGESLPSETELQAMRPLRCNYLFWDNRLDHSYVDANVPKNYLFAGTIPPLITEETNSYSGWSTGGSVYRQRQWEQIPELLREQFKAASRDDTIVELEGHQVRRSTSRIHESILDNLTDMSELSKLPCLTQIQASRLYDGLLPYLRHHPFVIELQLGEHGCTSLDLRDTHLQRLSVYAGGLERLVLNPELSTLSLWGPISPKLQIIAEDQGRWIHASFTSKPPLHCGLDRLKGLHLTGITELDLLPVIQSYPMLQELRLWGKPGVIANIGSIAALPKLKTFSTSDLFGFTPEEFPHPEQLPQLTWLWMSSLPADAAKSIKARFKKEVANGLDLSITKPRKPEWLAENLDNPFRDWDGREHITSAIAKKAAALYKKTSAEIHALIRRALDESEASEVQAQLNAIVRQYAEAFNRMDRRQGFIETVEREEIYAVLSELLNSAAGRLAMAGVSVDMEELYAAFDAVRDY
ncbi:hypothetical protein GCM10023310_06050 [Paenibacillus vulneris]|uniref:Gliding motility protein n=1 Tax=Paenibacillus vulneris TaxID=1133364 RepID=A0ABW3UQF4_9BACL